MVYRVASVEVGWTDLSPVLERAQKWVLEAKARILQPAGDDVTAGSSLSYAQWMNGRSIAEKCLAGMCNRQQYRFRNMQDRSPAAQNSTDVPDELTHRFGGIFHVVIADERVIARHCEFYAVDQAIDVPVRFANLRVTRQRKVTALDRSNHPQHITGVAGPIDHAGAAYDQAPIRTCALPAFMHQFRRILRGTIRRIRAYCRGFADRTVGGAVDADAAGEEDIVAANRLGVIADVSRPGDIGIEVLMKLMTRLAMDGSQVEDPLRPLHHVDRKRLAHI